MPPYIIKKMNGSARWNNRARKEKKSRTCINKKILVKRGHELVPNHDHFPFQMAHKKQESYNKMGSC
jgi:hypothetical protein